MDQWSGKAMKLTIFWCYKKCVSIGIKPSWLQTLLIKYAKKKEILRDKANKICIQDACIRQDYAFSFDTEKMFNFTRDVCQLCGDNPVCCYFEGISCRACFDFFKRTVKSKKSYLCKEFDACPIRQVIEKKTWNKLS